MEDTNQGEGNETPQAPAPTPIEPGTDNHSSEPEPTISEGPGNDVVAEPESLSETIQVDKRAIEFLERNLGHEAMRYFKEYFLK